MSGVERSALARVRKLVGRALNRAGRLVISPVNETPSYYPESASCQIRGLSALYELFLGRKEEGLFVEVGANDGVYVSNSWGLAERKWRGLMVEPLPDLAEQCRLNHRSHPLVKTLQCAVSGPDMPEVTLYVAGALTTGSRQVHDAYRDLEWAAGELSKEVVTVPARTLDELFEEQGIDPRFDVLIVDVEGFESEVFSGFTLSEWKPRMLIVELTDAHPTLRVRAVADAKLTDEILGQGYRIVYKDIVNTVFVRSDVALTAMQNPHE